MPESRTRKSAADKQRLKAQRTSKPKKIKAPASRRWVPPTFIAVGLLGVAWLITYYVAGQYIPFMEALGNWNILIGMGGMAAACAWRRSGGSTSLVKFPTYDGIWTASVDFVYQEPASVGNSSHEMPSRSAATHPASEQLDLFPLPVCDRVHNLDEVG